MAAKQPSTVAPRASHKVPGDLVNELLGRIKRVFYPDDEKRFYWERDLLIQALTYPAWYLRNRAGDGVGLPWSRYESIILGMLRTIKEHGDTAGIRSFGRYFLTAVQTHMPLHWEDYYAEAKRASNLFDSVIAGIAQGTVPAPDTTVRDLAALHSDLALKSGRKPKAKPQDSSESAGIQIELF